MDTHFMNRITVNVDTRTESILGSDEKQRHNRIPLWIKVVLTSFMAVLIPVYTYRWGPSNFLWFCDVALIVTLIGVWRESPRLISMQAVAIVLPQMLWISDFVGRIVAGVHINGSTAYMFNAENDLFARFLSLFHFWMPLLLIYLVWRVGFDRKAIRYQVVLCWAVLITCFLVLPHPAVVEGAENVNKIWGWSDPYQTVMSKELWLGCVMLIYPIAIYLPSHFLFRWLAPQSPKADQIPTKND
jgi:hypothetical protein